MQKLSAIPALEETLDKALNIDQKVLHTNQVDRTQDTFFPPDQQETVFDKFILSCESNINDLTKYNKLLDQILRKLLGPQEKDPVINRPTLNKEKGVLNNLAEINQEFEYQMGQMQKKVKKLKEIF